MIVDEILWEIVRVVIEQHGEGGLLSDDVDLHDGDGIRCVAGAQLDLEPGGRGDGDAAAPLVPLLLEAHQPLRLWDRAVGPVEWRDGARRRGELGRGGELREAHGVGGVVDDGDVRLDGDQLRAPERGGARGQRDAELEELRGGDGAVLAGDGQDQRGLHRRGVRLGEAHGLRPRGEVLDLHRHLAA